MTLDNLLAGPPPTLLPVEDGPLSALNAGDDPVDVAKRYPSSSLAWAIVSDQAWAEGRILESYAFARVGYHRGLDALRRNGWKGHGSVPWGHEANRGFLRCLVSLGRAAQAIDEQEEADRIEAFLNDCDLNIPRGER
ncbi:MAG: DUF3151 domain-containing protein [Candidatus Nanopelagicales bacterium]